ncbi:monosaccharide ABC transporter substrate-binding protein, CUT2 family [Flavobacterium glycines]|uniref:histidine kinase n=1 Tax=Flavobacterium glycines TaxID=551990 RepID=A0A1B9DGS6_9FLAO|nr:substrate-binding domain-containing protein [Flavobacterium glycines]OCB68901.1 AraC family transcriptional regulator [Flavobacterium glycines]GEL11092.1 sensor histidine kinase [Flavobacterium glycines]SDJ29042.1 monosaccharide ABC transporter substrate-binding protein, CUT2 family [Flavobacterium glycines]
MSRIYTIVAILFFLYLLNSCNSSKENEETISIGFSQIINNDLWRKSMDHAMEVEASLHPNVKLTIYNADRKVKQQIQDIEKMIEQNMDVIIVAPYESDSIIPVIEKANRKGIPLIIVDRKVNTLNYSAFLGADNVEVGKIAGKQIVSLSKGHATVVEIRGESITTPGLERSKGFKQILDKFPGIHKISVDADDFNSPQSKFVKILDSLPNIDYVFAFNDFIAYNAWGISKKKKPNNKIKFIGVDGLNGPNGGLELVKEGVLAGTILYPTGGAEAIKLALKIKNKEIVPKLNKLNTTLIDTLNAEIMSSQFDKISLQQSDIENQQHFIKEQLEKYSSQSNLLKALIILSLIIFLFAVHSIYSRIIISRKKKELEITNAKIISQRNEIEKFAEEIKRINEVRLNFFTGLSHEFKTPLTLIMSSTESLIENDKIKETKLIEEVKLIYKNSNRLLRLINQLLDFRKVEEQKFTLRASKIKIYDFTNDVMSNFKGEAIRRNIDFQLSCKNKNLELFIDRSLMDKVYFNLLSNAFKFTPDNGKINISIAENQDNTVNISFKDSGIGIPDKELSNVFKPFFRASNNNKNSSGIGLHLSKEFVLLHHGTIDLKSKQGTEFVITLMKGNDHLDASEIVENVENKNIAQNIITDSLELESDFKDFNLVTDSEKHSVLLIEDNNDLVFFLQAKLSNEYMMYTSDGSDAIEKALEIVPDIIICDINLVDKDGYEISKVLKKDLRTSHIPIIILTAQSNKESMLKGLQSGVDQYLTKPFSLSILKQSISSLLFNREKLRYYYTNNIYRVEPESRFGNQEQLFITKMNNIIKMNIEDPKFSVEDLADKLSVSRVQLYRKVKAIIGINISDHINNVKLEKAAELLKSNKMNISEIAYSLGFSSPNYFSTAFKNKFGISPKEFKSSL